MADTEGYIHRGGYTCFTPDPGKWKTAKCKVCGSECDVKRNVLGPRSWVGAMAKIETLHDLFTCPHTGEKWHIQAYELLISIENNPSERYKEMVQSELDELLEKYAK